MGFTVTPVIRRNNTEHRPGKLHTSFHIFFFSFLLLFSGTFAAAGFTTSYFDVDAGTIVDAMIVHTILLN